MRSFHFGGLIGRTVSRSVLTAACAALLAGCSNSIERFNEAYNNPSDADPVYTASVPAQVKKVKKPAYTEPVYDAQADDQIIESPVKRAAIPQAQKPVDYAQAYTTKPAYKKPVYNKPKLVVPAEETYDDASADSAPEPVAAQPAVPKKKAYQPAPAEVASNEAVNGKVKVEQGMTMYSIARANGLTVDELAQANNMVEPYTLMVGQSLRIPGSGAAVAPAPVAAKKAKAPVVEEDVADAAPAPAAKPKAKLAKGVTHTVGNGDTLYSLGRKYGVSPFVIADANGMTTDQRLTIGQTVKIPGASQQTAASESIDDPVPAAKPAKKKAPLSLSQEEEQQADSDAASSEEAIGETKPVAAAKPKVAVPEPEAQQQAALPQVGGLNLRWPVKGKVISTFGNKPNGLKNEGINIAVPEGAEVRAADTGVVAYAGNELKGYGNLVLIRHPGGYVTAYAHAKSLKVKRGDQVKRGDVIALAGQTGAVSSPQVHFEVRKGPVALDPLKFISSATASN